MLDAACKREDEIDMRKEMDGKTKVYERENHCTKSG